MKKLIAVLALIFIGPNLFSQQRIEVKETNENVGGGNHNCLVVTIYENDEDDLRKIWKSQLKKFKGKVSDKKEIFCDNALIKKFGDNTCDIYSKTVLEGEKKVKLVVAFDLGGAYLSSSEHPSKYNYARDLMYEFAISATKEGISNQLKKEAKILSKLEKDKRSLERSNERLHDDIALFEQKIERAKADVEKNITDQEDKKKEIDQQAEVVKKVESKLKAVK